METYKININKVNTTISNLDIFADPAKSNIWFERYEYASGQKRQDLFMLGSW